MGDVPSFYFFPLHVLLCQCLFLLEHVVVLHVFVYIVCVWGEAPPFRLPPLDA